MFEKNNSEIKFRWLRLCLKGDWKACYPHVVQFVTEQGRMKFVRPLYRELHAASGDHVSRDLAVKTFNDCRSLYHNIAATMIAKDLKV